MAARAIPQKSIGKLVGSGLRLLRVGSATISITIFKSIHTFPYLRRPMSFPQPSKDVWIAPGAGSTGLTAVSAGPAESSIVKSNKGVPADEDNVKKLNELSNDIIDAETQKPYRDVSLHVMSREISSGNMGPSDGPNGGSHDYDDPNGSGVLTVIPPTIRYPHHFDTYKTFKQLQTAGFTNDQAVAIMKAIRGQLVEHLQQAQGSLLSQAELENEAYLFDAACSELRIEIQNNRKALAQLEQTEMAALQREFGTIERNYQEVKDVMKNEISISVNDYKNANKIDSKAKEIQIQQLRNRIDISITSDLRGEVEALRWQTTRRGLITIGFIAMLILTALSVRERRIKAEKAKEKDSGKVDSGSSSELPIDVPELLYLK
ncbi:uncharacterized protein V1516DRAFT_665224 [Lipomyces oligophaga]|uniref:uncharacterized protein n=1 Tax=Lipomyces oligophaga TaxID=45792 RepID=UPI0034CF8A80